MKRFVIIGLFANQATNVRKEWGKSAKLTFLSPDCRLTTLPSAEHCLLLVKFIPHSITKKAFLQYPRERVHLVKGGMTHLVSVIRGLIEDEVRKTQTDRPKHRP